jgi:hypothetical protein
MVTNFSLSKGQNGLLRPLIMKTLVVPAYLRGRAISIVKSAQTAGNALNDKNYITEYGLDMMVHPYLTSQYSWFGLTDMSDDYELVWLWGKKPEFKDWSPSDNPDVWGKRCRMVFTTGCDAAPRHIRGNAGAAL